MADKILTPEFRAAFISVFRASKARQAPAEQEPRFSVRAAFPPTTDLSTLKANAKQAAEDKWGAGKVPKTMRSPFRLNSELENPVQGLPDDWIIVTFSAKQDRKPGVVDANVQDIIDESECYSGAWYRVQTNAFAYDTAGNKGVSFGLENVQKTREGDSLGGGKTPANKAFAPVGGGAPAANTTDNLFD